MIFEPPGLGQLKETGDMLSNYEDKSGSLLPFIIGFTFLVGAGFGLLFYLH